MASQPTVSPLRYRKLGYVALNVTDLDRSTAFYRDVVGLDLVERFGDGMAYFQCSQDHHNVVLCAAAAPGVKRIGWELEDEGALERARSYFAEIGLAPEILEHGQPEIVGQGRSIRIVDPTTCLTFEYYARMMQMAKPFESRVVKIARIGHVVLRSADYAASLDFATATLNFRVSDYFGDRLAFMRCFPNPYHHSFALGRGSETGLHHVNFMVSDIDDIGSSIHRLIRLGVPIVYGPGRHPPSGSVFLYFLDPDEMTLEYSFGMEKFPEHEAREPRLLEPVPAALDYWGSPRDSRYAAVGTIERRRPNR